jgi:polyhydroxybutyrate depolymerase
MPPLPTAKASRGCASTASPGTLVLTPNIAGRVRTAIVHVPPGYQRTTPVPLVINMHGSQSTALEQMGLTGMNTTADADGFIVAYPQGDIPSGTGFEWNVPGQPLFGGSAVPAGAPDDVSFITQLVTLLEHRYCIDTNRVFATGFSGGARMASQLACNASDVFAAVAPVSGLRLPSPCPSTRPVPVIAFHGTADPVDPYNGNGQKYWTYSVPEAATRWGAHNGCSTPPQLRRYRPRVVITQYAPCSQNAVVELFTIAGEGHEWPGGPKLTRAITRVLGPQTYAVSANDEMWEFFMAHPLAAK